MNRSKMFRNKNIRPISGLKNIIVYKYNNIGYYYVPNDSDSIFNNTEDNILSFPAPCPFYALSANENSKIFNSKNYIRHLELFDKENVI